MSSIENWDKYLAQQKKTFEEKLRMEPEPSVSSDDFRFLTTIGRGMFGTVVLAINLTNDEHCAVKVLEKANIVNLNKVSQALNEKRLLLAIEFPFLVNMLHFFKDNANLYYVMPFVNGGELFDYLRKRNNFDEPLSAFYASQVVLALEYLHSLDIVYRDLKPENVLIYETGFIKLADLGFAKIVKSRTYSICGTPDYIAPEVIFCRGYSHAVDWWALGVFVYEMVAGFPPFYATETMKTYQLIAAGRYRMIQTFSEELKDLIVNLLKVDTTQRIGSLKSGANDIKQHRWFRHITWLDIANQKVKPPFVPTVAGPDDTSNFVINNEVIIAESAEDLFKEEFKDF